jgi:hypothetical protein
MARQRLNIPMRGGPPCGKIRHWDEKAARDAQICLVESEKINGKHKPGPVLIYWCYACEAYHVGHHAPAQ